ncbi:MAG: MATE family efflux transporter [Planctomycetia bacterium]
MAQAVDDGGAASARRVLWLALPVLVESLLAMSVQWSDAIITGKLFVEPQFLAAVTVAGYFVWLMESGVAVVSLGAQAVVARLVGAADPTEAGAVVQQALLLAVLVGSALAVGVLLGADAAIGLMSLEGASHQLAVDYLRIVALSGPLMALLLVGCTCLRAAGDTLAGMWIMLTVDVVNIAFSWGLAVGFGPLPQLGFAGVAVGTATAFGFGGLLATTWLLVGKRRFVLPRTLPVPRPDRLVRLLRVGVPGAAGSLQVVLCHLWYLAIIGRLGDEAVAAHGIAVKCESVSFLAGDAFAVAAATLVGQSLGAGRPDLARAYGWKAFQLGAAVMGVWSVLFFFVPRVFLGLFTDPSQTNLLDLAAPLLQVVALAAPALAALSILTGALRGAGDVRWPLVYNTFGLLFLRIPLAYLFTGPLVPLGVFGAWIAMVVDLYVRGAAAFLRFRHGGWRHTIV